MSQKTNRSKIPYFFLAFFIVVLAVNIAYIYLAKKTWRGTTTDNAYQKGLNYNQTLEEIERQKKLGWKMNLKFSPYSSGKGRVMVDVQGADNRAIADAAVAINFRNPVQTGYDFVIPLKRESGVYVGEVTFPMKGQWDFEVVINKGTDSFQEVKRYVIQ